jgi:hypothetical protein
VQRSAILTTFYFIGGPAGLGQRPLAIDQDPGLDPGFEAVDALQALLDQVSGGELALADGHGGFMDGQWHEHQLSPGERVVDAMTNVIYLDEVVCQRLFLDPTS